jgi:hypothetical protein
MNFKFYFYFSLMLGEHFASKTRWVLIETKDKIAQSSGDLSSINAL